MASMARGAPVQRRERMDERQRKPWEGGGTRERATALICWFSSGRRGAELLARGQAREAGSWGVAGTRGEVLRDAAAADVVAGGVDGQGDGEALGAHGPFGIEQRREEEARPRALVGGRWIWEDPEVGFECGGGRGGILGSWSRVCPNSHVGGLDVDYIYGKGGELDHPIKIRRSRIDRLGKSK